jgi:large subunit ribosomal protein L27
MAHKKGLGSSRNGRESNPNMLGVKVFAGQKVTGGEIIVRQRGTRFWPGEGTGLGRDHTIFATRGGVFDFKTAPTARTISVLAFLGAGGGAGTPLQTPLAMARGWVSGEGYPPLPSGAPECWFLSSSADV